MKKIAVTLFAAVLAVAMLAACASNGSDPTPTPTTNPTSAPTTKPSTVPTTSPTTVPTTTPTTIPTTAPTTAPSEKSAFAGQIQTILNQLISQTIDKKNLADEELKNIICYDKPVDADSCQDILGLTPAEFASSVVSAIESKPEGSWFAHSIVLIECQKGVDVAALADQISKGTNPARFGCIKVEAVVAGYAGQHILLCASCQNTCEAVYATFHELSAVPSLRIDRANDWNGGGMLGQILG